MKENRPLQTLKKNFGFDSFRPLQEKVIEEILAGKDSLVVMPTGSGKSILYQLPALIMDGLTLVISPLIALMKDQVSALKTNGIPAEYINSMLSQKESEHIFDLLREQKLKLLYVAPETLLTSRFLSFIEKQNLSLIAVDEAHCISTWGHDFRPEYSKLSLLREKFPNVPFVALTATADKITRDDIVEQLKLKEATITVSSFDRPNLSLSVKPGIDRFEVILDLIDRHPNSSGIIYCLSRKSTEELSEKLKAHGLSATHYHAGMQRDEREMAQEAFIRDETQIICATIAFGMGIDKSNIRWIIHYNMPKSIENYYQEIGRAGRDGLASETLLFYSYRDVILLRKFAEDSGQPEIQLAKLNRMQQFAEANACRRIVLLSYFNEHKEENCGNCDVCHDPPQTFDGTVLAQKALSAMLRLKENVASGMLIDVLRGSGKREIFENKFHQIKTYGAGRDLKYTDWQQYLLQMLHLGLFDIAYNDGQKLKVSALGKKVLFEQKNIDLVKVSIGRNFIAERKEKVKKLTKTERLALELSNELKALRKTIADAEDVPAYVIFNDKSIEEMALVRPGTLKEMANISGVGDFKLKKYGSDFLKRIIDYKIENKDRGSTSIYTKKLLDDGKDIHEIAHFRDLNINTIIGHLVDIYERSDDFDIYPNIPSFDLKTIMEYIQSSPPQIENKEVFNHFKGRYEFYQIRLAFIEIEKSKE